MRDPLDDLIQSFGVLSAYQSPAASLDYLRTTNNEWTVVRRPVSDDETYYYAIPTPQLEFELQGLDDNFEQTLVDVLNLHEPDSNDLFTADGRFFNPVRGVEGRTGAGRFSPAAILVESDVPTALLVPQSHPSGIRHAPGAEELRVTATDEVAGVPSAPDTTPTFITATAGAEFPEMLAKDEVATLQITLAAGDEDLSGTTTLLEVAPAHPVRVMLSLSANLALVNGQRSMMMQAPTPGEPPTSAICDLRALQEGPARIIIRFYQQDLGPEDIGYLELRPRVTPAPIANASILAATGSTFSPSFCPSPDWVLYIDEDRSDRGVVLSFELTSGPGYPEAYDHFELGRKELDAKSDLYFRQRFSWLERIPFATDDDVRAADLQIQTVGKSLYGDLLTTEVQNQLERNGHRISSIQIRTPGHHIPWEMIMLPPFDRDGVTLPQGFLAARYQVIRWINGYAPPGQLYLRDLSYTAPNYGGGANLPERANEVAYLESLRARSLAPNAITAREVPVLEAMLSGQFDVFHYVGHAAQTEGEAPESSLALETEERVVDGVRKLRPHSLVPTAMTNHEDAWKARQPLIFLNACQTGRADIGLVRLGGFAQACLRSKAGAFVGTLWSVRDSAARLFAETFYDALLANQTLGQAAQTARLQVAATHDPSWLAYVVYGHPNARATIARS